MARVRTAVKSKKVTIVVENENFVFFKKMLCRESEYFASMFNGNFNEAKKKAVKLEDVGLEEFRFFSYWICSMRSNFKSVRGVFLLKMLVFANRFMVHRLRKQCYQGIKQWMQSQKRELCYDVLESALEIEDSELRRIFDEWFHENVILPQNNCVRLLEYVLRLDNVIGLSSKAKKEIMLMVMKQCELIQQSVKDQSARITKLQARIKELRDAGRPAAEHVEARANYDNEVKELVKEANLL